MGNKGWGAYTVDAIPARTFVAEYTGEVLPVQEARRRVPAYDRDGLNYLLTTQEFFQGVRTAGPPRRTLVYQELLSLSVLL